MQEIRRRGLKVVVAGIPKTIDNDIPVLLMDDYMFNGKAYSFLSFLLF